MIQRIQTLWLLLASGFTFLSMFFSFYTGNKLVNNVSQFAELNGLSTIWLICLSVAIGVASFVAIFLFKDRKRQLWITLTCFICAIVYILLYFYEIRNFVPGNGTFSLTSVFSFLIPIFLLFASRGIYKDEKLVRSVDRLR